MENIENLEVLNVEDSLNVESSEESLYVENEPLFVDSGLISADDIFASMGHSVQA